MASVLAILGWLLLTLLASVLALLVLPTHLAAAGHLSAEHLDGSADADWAWGLVAVHAGAGDGVVLRLAGFEVWRRRGPAERADRDAKPEKKKETRKGKRRPAPRLILRVLRRSLASLRLRLRLAGRLGPGDPCEAAKLFGTLAAAQHLLPGLDARGLTIDWIESVVDLDGQLQGRVWPAAIAWIAATEWWRAR